MAEQDPEHLWLRAPEKTRPGVLFTKDWDGVGAPVALAQMPVQLLYFVSRTQTLVQAKRTHQRLQELYPRWTVTVLTPLRGWANVPGLFCGSEGVTVQESYWQADVHVRHYSAVVCSTMEPYHQLQLLSALENGLVVFRKRAQIVARADVLRRTLPKSYFMAAERGGWSNPDFLAGFYQQAHVGLLTSAVDHNARTAVEMHLCGLPIVCAADASNALRLSPPPFVRLVPAEAKSVQAALAEFRKADYDPEAIRKHTLAEVQDARKHFDARFGSLDWRGLPPRLCAQAVEDWEAP